MTLTSTRFAAIAIPSGDRDNVAAFCDRLAAYMPTNYAVSIAPGLTLRGAPAVLVAGEDRAGWTLEDYVLPRLASGLYYGEEIDAESVAMAEG
jgi:hypothetical protein